MELMELEDGQFSIEKLCLKTQSAEKAFKAATGVLRENDEKMASKRIEECIYSAKVNAHPKTAIDYEARCRDNPRQAAAIADDVRAERHQPWREETAAPPRAGESAEAAVMRNFSAEPLGAAFTSARTRSSKQEFMDACMMYLYVNSGTGTTRGQFAPFCQCAWDARVNWDEQARERCRSCARPPCSN